MNDTIRRIVAGLGLVLLAGCPAEECAYYNDCPSGEFCNADRVCEVARLPCEQQGESKLFLSQGLLADTEHWACAFPQTTNPDGPRITGLTGWPVVVTGGSLVLSADFEGVPDLAGQNLIVGLIGASSWHWVPVSDNDVPFPLELFVKSDAPSDNHRLGLAIDDGTGTASDPHPGPVHETNVNVIAVRGGDIQVSLSWDQPMDVDLHVLDPVGDAINYGSRTADSGGELDLDSNAACGSSDFRTENVYWPLGGAPSGTYKVWVNLWSECGLTSTNWRLTRVLSGGGIDVVEGTVFAADVLPGFFGTTEVDETVNPPTLEFTF